MPNYWGHPRPELSRLLYEDEALLWGGTIEGVDGTNVDDLTRAEVEVREQFFSEFVFLKKYVPGFQKAKLKVRVYPLGFGIHAMSWVNILSPGTILLRSVHSLTGWLTVYIWDIRSMKYRLVV